MVTLYLRWSTPKSIRSNPQYRFANSNWDTNLVKPEQAYLKIAQSSSTSKILVADGQIPVPVVNQLKYFFAHRLHGSLRLGSFSFLVTNT